MANFQETSNAKKGGLFVGKTHAEGGIPAVVTDTGQPIEVEGGEAIINKEATAKYWKELSKINQSAGNGVPIPPPYEFSEKITEKLEQGGKLTNKEKSTIYSKWRRLINMTASDLQRYYDSPDGQTSGLTQKEADKQGIDSGRESARMIIKMKRTRRALWTPDMWRWAKKQISFVSRMRGLKGDLYDPKRKKTRKLKALLIWGHDPKKYRGSDSDFKEGGVAEKFFEDTVGHLFNKEDKKVARPYTIRFHLGAGENFMKWKVENTDTKEVNFYEPDQYQIFMFNCKLVNSPKTAMKIYTGEINKTPIAWVQCERVEVLPIKEQVIDIDKLSYNPQKTPNWVDTDGDVIDNYVFPELVTFNRGVYYFHDGEVYEVGGKTEITNKSDLKSESDIEIQNNDENYYPGGTLKYKMDGKEVGYLNYEYDLTSSISETLIDYDSELYISIVHVDENYRGHGIAKKLLKKVISIAKDLGVDVVSLYRDSGLGCNPGSKYDTYLKGVYESVGFKDNGLEENCTMILTLKNQYAKGGLLAPNGNPTNLTPEQYKLVRTPEFKAWFGDWETDPENASKVVDENGEPLVVYRGSKSKNPNYIPHKHELSNGIYFSTKKEVAELYTTSVWQNWVGRVFECFLNIRNLDEYDTLQLKSNIYQADFDYYNKIVTTSYENKFDGIRWDNFIDVPDLQNIYPKEPIDFIATTFIVFEPEQIKLADGSNTTFDPNNPDIRYANGGLIAPNGKLSNLTPEQYKLVRTPEFKAWFGDWENDPANASKVVDENGEPMQMYHNTNNNKFTIFDKEKLGDSSGWETAYLGFYFSNKFEKGSYGKKTIKCFLNIKNPFFIKTEYYGDFDMEYKRKTEALLMDNFFNKNKYDGILINVEKLQLGETADKVFVAFEPEQIKLADGSNTTFDPNNPDIRYAEGGSIQDLSEYLNYLEGEDLETMKAYISTLSESKIEDGIKIEQAIKTLTRKYRTVIDDLVEIQNLEEKRTKVLDFIKDPSNNTKVIIAFSGGKDSVAMVLRAIYDWKIPKSQIELWHHEVDGFGENLFDWKCTPSYCRAFAKEMGVPLLFSYSDGGILKEMYRENDWRQPVYFQAKEGGEFIEVLPERKEDQRSTRRKFPAVGSNLETRWCSSVAKIEVMGKAITNNPEYKTANIVIMTGERREESGNRAKYKEIERYRNATKTRNAITWRSIIDMTESEIWDLYKKHKIQPHPCYELGWGRCSCQLCIFSEKDTWASINELTPKKVERIVEIEKDFGHTLYNEFDKIPYSPPQFYKEGEKAGQEKMKRGEKLANVYEAKVVKGKSFIPKDILQRWSKEALGEFVSPIIVEGEWKLPYGAFSQEQSGAN